VAELVEQGHPFYRTLVTTLRAGNLFWHRERRRVRTVARVVTYTRVHFDPIEGEPDHEDFEVHGPDARQWASKGVLSPYAAGATLEMLEAGWEHRDDAADDHRPPYPT